MVHQLRFARPLLCLCLAAAACKPQASTAFPDADRQAILTAEQAAGNAIRDKDWAKWTGAFTEDGALLPPNGPAVEGRAAILLDEPRLAGSTRTGAGPWQVFDHLA